MFGVTSPNARAPRIAASQHGDFVPFRTRIRGVVVSREEER